MSTTDAAVRSDIIALKQSLSNELVRQAARSLATPSSAMLALGPDCEELPAKIIEDSVLLPVDKLIWLIMRIAARRGGGLASLPTMSQLGIIANVGSRNTVAKSISILRCRRWLIACKTSSRRNGARWGSAYTLHSAPLDVVNTLHLDPDYLSFVEKAIRHSNPRVRNVASEVLGRVR